MHDSKNWPAMNTSMRAVAELAPYAKNARLHSKSQITKLAASITEFGWTNPVLVSEDDTIIAGHGRVLAAELLGIEMAPVAVARGWTKAQVQAYVIADNQLTLDSSWDNEILAAEIAELESLNFDIDKLGFEQEELDEIRGIDPESVKEDPPPLQPPPVSRDGDVWVMGEHRLLCGDSTDPSNWKKLMAGREADLVWTDPPYGVSYVGGTKDALTIENDDLSAADLQVFLKSALSNASDSCKKGGVWYVTAPAGPLFHVFGSVLLSLEVWRHTITWVKDALVLGRADFHYRHEPIFYGWKPGAAHRPPPDRKQDTVWEFARPKKSADHPTMKPIGLIQHAIMMSTKVGELVIDPFLGSGSTLLAAASTQRICFGMELSPLYADVVVRRWQEHTGKSARLEGTKNTFATLKRRGLKKWRESLESE